MSLSWTWLVVITLLTFILFPISTYLPPELSFFGVYAGSVLVSDTPLEHEAIGIGILLGVALLFRRSVRWMSYLLLLVGVFMVISEATRGFQDIPKNPEGSILSIMLGLIYSIAFLKVIPYVGEEIGD